MIMVNVRKSGETAVTPAQVAEAAAGDWVVSQSSLDAGYADVLLAVRRNQVLGAYDVLSWEDMESGRVRFELADSEKYAVLVGGPSPLAWKRGQVNPVQYLETDAVSLSGPLKAQSPSAVTGKPRRGVHRITIETKGLSDVQAANLHHVLLAMAASTGHLHKHRSTSLVREMRAAQEACAYDYVSASSPTALRN